MVHCGYEKETLGELPWRFSIFHVCCHTKAFAHRFYSGLDLFLEEMAMLNPRCNGLLDQLSDTDSRLLFQHLRLVSLQEGQQIYASGDVIEQVYFPVTALIAIAKEMKNGTSIDVALIGRASAAGLRGMISRCPHRVFVTSSGLAYQISLEQLMQIQDYQSSRRMPEAILGSSPWLTRMFVQATTAVCDSTALETGCAHFHSTRDRVARWLLTRYAHCQSLWIDATHQKIADSLGVRRESVTNVLLQFRGIQCARKHIEIHDFSAIESQACECYRDMHASQSSQLRLPFHSHH